MTQLERRHIEGFMAHLHEHINARTGRPLTARSRYTCLSPLLQFFRDTSQWGWDDVPARPLLGRSDMPELPSALPRFIPRAELDRLMEAVEDLEDPHQRASPSSALERRPARGDRPADPGLPGRLPGRLSAASDPGRQDLRRAHGPAASAGSGRPA
ncbi:hypothetical protein [Streptomyces sp. NPDC057557]|uniref:hypothetical protein n=1 Tax=Streptomyces sp. NPDC057557 TaxID=3346167 RepID=UPI00367E39B2